MSASDPSQSGSHSSPSVAPETSHPPAVIAGFSGWLLDAFDFFRVTFCLTAMAHDFHKTDAEIALIITMTMAFRPVGGLIFGFLADRYGRRGPLMINTGIFAISDIMTGLAPNYTSLLVVRALFGIVMGGCWGVGASLMPWIASAMANAAFSPDCCRKDMPPETCLRPSPISFSSAGSASWRPIFYLGSLPAIVPWCCTSSFSSRNRRCGKRRIQVAPEAVAGTTPRNSLSLEAVSSHLLAFMTMMLFASHGTQDMYPTFLQRQWHFGPPDRATITAISGIGAIVGGLVFGHLSDRWGRRKAIVTAFVLATLLIPLWAYAPNTILLVVGAFLMQFMVQGAWGVIPAHLAELSPDSVRALLPGFAYQSAGFIASSAPYIEAAYAQRTSYATAMALVAVSVFILACVMVLLGGERHGQKFGA